STRDYEIVASSIHSFIESGRLLMDHALAQRIPRRYVSEQMLLLNEKLNESLRELEVAQASDLLEPKLTNTGRAAERAAEILREIANSQEDRWSELSKDLAAVSTELHEIH